MPRFLVGACLAVATALATPWNAVAATITTPHSAPSATHSAAKSPHADKARKSPGTRRGSREQTDPDINGCDFTQTPTTWTLAADCTATATIMVPDGITLNGNGKTITVEGGFTGAVVENAAAAAAMSIENLTIQGSSLFTGTCAPIVGILLSNAGGSLTNVHVVGMTRNDGCQTGLGIWINVTSARTVTITGSSASEFQKAGLVANGPVTIDVSGSTFGPPDSRLIGTGVIATNAVQISRGAGGTFTGNTVIGGGSGHPDAGSTGIVVFEAADVTITGNTIGGLGLDTGILVADSTGITIDANHITHTGADFENYFDTAGIFVDENSSRVFTTGNTLSDWNEPIVDARTEPYITTKRLPRGTVGTAYSALLEAIAEEQPIVSDPGSVLHWSVTHGSLPPGLKVKNDAAIIGTPTKAGVFTFTLRVDDVIDGTSASREFTITIRPARVSLHVTKTAFPNPAAAGQPVTFTITVFNGGPDNALGVTVHDGLPASLSGFTWTCSASAAPSRCSVTSGTGPISGTPVEIAARGTVTFKVSGVLPAHAGGQVINTVSVTPAPGTVSPDCTPDCSASVAVSVGPALPLTGPDLLPEAVGGTGLIALGGLILLPAWRRRRRVASGSRSRG